MTDGPLGQVNFFLRAMFVSDSEYERLLLIQTPLSYKLNPTTLGTFSRQNVIVVGSIEMAKRFRAVETLNVPFGMRTGGLNDLLVSVIDETLKHVFREEGVVVIYDFIENKCHLKREEIVEKPEVFSAGLKRLLVSGAPVIEKMILENLCSKLDLKLVEKEGYEFSDYIKELRERLDVEG